MKTIKIVGLVMMTTLLVSCSNHWILEKERMSEVSEVAYHAERLQQHESSNNFEKTSFAVFTIAEGRKMVVISSGNESKALEFVKIDVDKKNKTIIVKEKLNETDEINPFLLVGLDKITGNLQVYNESTNEFIEQVDKNLNPFN